MPWAIIDTDVYIDHWEGVQALDAVLTRVRRAFIIRHSSVVLSELRRGARTAAAKQHVASLYRLAAVRWVPLALDWWTAGDLIRTVGDARRWDVTKRRGFQNDVLIALTARRYGATLITRNREDFALLEKPCTLTVVYV